MSNLQTIIEQQDLCLSVNQRGTDKLRPHSYIEGFYEREFKKFRSKPVRLLEIGFRHGASLALWSTYFSDGLIFGVDNHSDLNLTNEHPINESWTERPNVTTIFGDAYSQEFANKLDGKFDILIDDGPHTLSSQVTFIKLYADKLAGDGIAVIEDLVKFGGLLLWPLMLSTPLKYEVEFHDFRNRSGLSDDLIFTVRNSGKNQILSRIKLSARGVYYLLVDPVRILIKKYVLK